MKDLYDVLRCCKKALEEYSSLLGEDRDRLEFRLKDYSNRDLVFDRARLYSVESKIREYSSCLVFIDDILFKEEEEVSGIGV